jgi:hypothetical protein
MQITILNQKSEVVEIIPACIPEADAITAAENLVREAALRGEKYTAVDEDGENALSPDFQQLIDFIPHGRRIASNLMDRMAHNPTELHMLLSGSPKMTDLITAAITEYFEKQISIGKEYLAMPEHKRLRVREHLFNMIAPNAA